MNVFELFAKLGLDTSEYDQGLDDSEKKASRFGSKLGGVLSTGAKVAGVSLAAVGTGAAILGKTLSNNISGLAQYGDNIDKSSQKLGVSAEFYQEWEAVLQHSGTSMSSMTATFKTLANATQQTTEAQSAAFEALGLSVDDLRNLSTEEVFSSVIYALQDMEEGTERTAIAADLLGRGAMEMGALLNTSAKDTKAMITNVHNLGGVLSDTAVKDAAAYQDALQDMQTSMSGLKNNLTSEFLPSITEAMNGLSLIFSGDDGGLAQINEGVSNFTSSLVEQLPKIIEVGMSILESLANAIIENIPQLASTAVTVMMEFVSYLIENLPLIIDSALQVILALANGIAQSLPTLIPAIVNVILEIVNTLIDNLDMLLEAALAIIVGLAQGLIQALPQLIAKLPEIITSIIEFFLGNIPLIIDAAIQIVMALVQALPQIISALIEAIPLIITGIIDAVLNNIPLLVEAGINLFIALIQALPEIIIAIVEAIPQIITGIVEAFKNAWPQIKETGKKLLTMIIEGLTNIGNSIKDGVGKVWQAIKNTFAEKIEGAKQWGKDLIDNFVGGIKDKINKVKDTVSNVASTVKDFLGFSEPEEGPLSNFHTYAPDMMKLFAEGIRDNEDLITDQIDRSFDFGDRTIKSARSIETVDSRASDTSDLTDAIREALEGFEIDWNGKNLGRLVQKYA